MEFTLQNWKPGTEWLTTIYDPVCDDLVYFLARFDTICEEFTSESEVKTDDEQTRYEKTMRFFSLVTKDCKNLNSPKIKAAARTANIRLKN